MGVLRVTKIPATPTRVSPIRGSSSQKRGQLPSSLRNSMFHSPAARKAQTNIVPGLPWIMYVNPEVGAPRMVLFTDDPAPEKSVAKVVDFVDRSYSSTEMFSMYVEAYRGIMEGPTGRNARAQLLYSGSVELVKYDRMFFCFTEHYFTRYCRDTGLWILEGITDGTHPNRFYQVQHPVCEYITVQFVMADQILAQSVKRMGQHELVANRLAYAPKVSKDLFPPRRTSNKKDLQRLFLSKFSGTLHAMTGKRMFEYRELGQGETGFYATSSTVIDDLGKPNDPQLDRVHQISDDLTLSPY